MMKQHISPLIYLLATCTLIFSASCEKEAHGNIEMPKKMVNEPRRFLERLLVEGIDKSLRTEADTGVSAKEVKALLKKEVPKSWRKRVRGGIKYADLHQKLYTARNNRKIVSTYDGINEKGKLILAVLDQSGDHVLNTRYYSLKRIKALDKLLKQRASKDAQWKTIELSPKEGELILSWIKEHKLDVKDPKTRTVLLSALSGPEPDAVVDEQRLPSPVPRITAQIKMFRDALAANAKEGAELELRLMDAALRYARDMKHFNLEGITWSQMKKAGGSKKMIYDRLEGFFTKIASASPKKAAQHMNALQPTHPQYVQLLKVRQHYVNLKKVGGWPRVTPVYLSKGKRNAAIKTLKKRMWLEGYIGKPIARRTFEEIAKPLAPPAFTDQVDEALLSAVKIYRRTHQLSLKGAPGRIFWKSLNVPVGRRLEQLEVNLKRLRSTMYKNEKDYIVVNLPEFYGESYVDNKLKHRFKVVVGKNNRKCDPKTSRWIHPNATPVLTSKMEYFILNPAWFVPDRIVREEIMPYMEEEGWLEKRNYTVVKKKGDSFVIRQDPGPKNALGKVKFIFPNPHNTYMHDTPRKQYFKMNIRAQSHGCMRVHKPIDLARHLVKAQGIEKNYDINSVIKTTDPKLVRMKNPLPVFVEYQTVRIDPDGHPQFFIDVYYKDRLAMAGKKDFGRCTPPPVDTEKPSDDIGP